MYSPRVFFQEFKHNLELFTYKTNEKVQLPPKMPILKEELKERGYGWNSTEDTCTSIFILPTMKAPKMDSFCYTHAVYLLCEHAGLTKKACESISNHFPTIGSLYLQWSDDYIRFKWNLKASLVKEYTMILIESPDFVMYLYLEMKESRRLFDCLKKISVEDLFPGAPMVHQEKNGSITLY